MRASRRKIWNLSYHFLLEKIYVSTDEPSQTQFSSKKKSTTQLVHAVMVACAISMTLRIILIYLFICPAPLPVNSFLATFIHFFQYFSFYCSYVAYIFINESNCNGFCHNPWQEILLLFAVCWGRGKRAAGGGGGGGLSARWIALRVS